MNQKSNQCNMVKAFTKQSLTGMNPHPQPHTNKIFLENIVRKEKILETSTFFFYPKSFLKQ